MSLALSNDPGGSSTESLPALIERAGLRLMEAVSSAEVMEAKQIAELAKHYAKVTGAANETHADCLRIITRAEIRMANEIDKGRETGEVERRGGDRVSSNVQSSDIASLDRLGVDRQRLSEWRALRDAGGEELVEQALTEALEEGRAPTKNDINKHVRGTLGTGENEWYTPAAHINAARAVLGRIELDPASSAIANATVGAEKIYTIDDDGLAQEWRGKVWMNPPYAQPWIARFMAKLAMECSVGNVTEAIALTHNYTDTSWFQNAAVGSSAICFTRGRIGFLSPEGKRAAPTQGQAFFYYGRNVSGFAEQFERFGLVMVRHGV